MTERKSSRMHYDIKGMALHFSRARLYWILTLSAVCFVMGALLAVQVRSRPEEERIFSTRFGVTGGGPIGALSQVLATTQQQVEEQTQEIASLRKQVTDYEEAIAKQKDITKPLAEQLSGYKVALGLTAAEGPGVILEVDDSTLAKDNAAQNLESMFIIHDSDLLQIANEMWAAGAEAISINGQRVVGGTAIRCVGPAIQINNVPIASPYKFIALGEPGTLMGSLNIPGGVLDRLRMVKFRVRLEQKDSLEVPPIATAKKFLYARPVESAAPPPPDRTSF